MADPLASACRLDYYPAAHESGQRSTEAIRWIILHDEEASTAESAAKYFKSAASGGSATLCVDDNTCFRCLTNETIPWGARSSFGANLHGFHIEQAGFARWSAVIWMSHLGTLKRAAYKTAFHCKLFHLPAVWVPAQGLLSGEKGITSHAEVTKASKIQDPTGDYTHTDPGPLWPRTTFMYLVRRYYKALA